MEYERGNQLIIADTEDKFIDAIIDLVINKQKATSLGVKARILAEKHYSLTLLIGEQARLAGDPVCVISNADKIKTLFQWQPSHDNLEEMILSMLAWEASRTV